MKVEILLLIKNSCRGGNIRKFSSISYVGDQTCLKGFFLSDLDLAENLDLGVCISCNKILPLSAVALAALPKFESNLPKEICPSRNDCKQQGVSVL